MKYPKSIITISNQCIPSDELFVFNQGISASPDSFKFKHYDNLTQLYLYFVPEPGELIVRQARGSKLVPIYINE